MEIGFINCDNNNNNNEWNEYDDEVHPLEDLSLVLIFLLLCLTDYGISFKAICIVWTCIFSSMWNGLLQLI